MRRIWNPLLSSSEGKTKEGDVTNDTSKRVLRCGTIGLGHVEATCSANGT